MVVLGVNIPEETVSAGLAVMTGDFQTATVEDAMRAAITKHMHQVLPKCQASTVHETVMRATDRLLQQQKKANAIVYNRKTRGWSKVA